MECKVSSSSFVKLSIAIGIYPEWNVKLILISLTTFCGYNWNISRMECKAKRCYSIFLQCIIGIYPEWNVKTSRHNHL